MAGKKGRSGRYKKYTTYDINTVADLSLKAIINALQSPNISEIEKARLAQPIVAKRFPDKVEQTNLNIDLQLSPEIANKLMEAYQRNSSIYRDLDKLKQITNQDSKVFHVEHNASDNNKEDNSKIVLDILDDASTKNSENNSE